MKSVEEELLFKFFKKPDYDNPEKMTTTEIAQVFSKEIKSYKITDASIRKIGQILNKNDFYKTTIKRGKSPIKCWKVQRIFDIGNLSGQEMFSEILNS